MACRDVSKGQQALTEIQNSGDKIQGTLSVLQLDVTDDSSIATAVETVRQQFGRVDAFISNAGTLALQSSGRAQLREMFDANVFGALLVSEAFIPLLLQSARPYLVQVSSALGSAGLASDPNDTWYATAWYEYRMTKAALNMATIQFHKRLSAQNVRVFAFCPGLVRSKIRGDSEEAITAQGAAGDPIDSAKGLVDIVQGRRDAEAGQFLRTDGSGSWPW